MSDLNELLANMQGEDVGTINFDAPDPGAFPPPIVPSQNIPFIFYLPDHFPNKVSNHKDAFETVEVGGKKCLQCNFGALITYTKADGSTGEKLVAFQRASTYKTDNMPNSTLAELVRSLGLKDSFEEHSRNSSGAEVFVKTLSEASGKVAGLANFGWILNFKDARITYKSSATKVLPPKKEGGYTTHPWPRVEGGGYAPTVRDPETGEEKYANLEITRFRSPKKVEVLV